MTPAEAISMWTSTILATTLPGDNARTDAVRSAAAFFAGFRSPDTPKGYRRDLRCWLEFWVAYRLHPYAGGAQLLAYWKTMRTARCFSASLYRRALNFSGDISCGMTHPRFQS